MNISEANAVNTLITFLAGRESYWSGHGVPTTDEALAAAETLANKANRVLLAGWTADRLRAAWLAGASTRGVLTEVTAERTRQDAKWGEQDHPDGTGPDVGLGMPGWARTYAGWAEDLRRATDQAVKAGDLTWSNILLEELFEALAENEPVKLRRELVQVAAVATAWVEAIDRRSRKGGDDA